MSSYKLLVAAVFGFLIGSAAGLIGVGGGEFRIPILLYVLDLPVLTSFAVNLLVGLVTIVVSFLRRLHLGLLDAHCLILASFMCLTSIFGAVGGASLAGKVPEKPLKKFLAFFLVIVGLKIGLEPFVEILNTPQLALSMVEEAFLAASTGLIIGVISGAISVAGGEFRIPILMYVFGLDIVSAGTTSLLVSIPTVASGFVKHISMGHVDRSALVIAIVMGAGSVVGALCGATYVSVADEETLKVLLGSILILATIRMLQGPKDNVRAKTSGC